MNPTRTIDERFTALFSVSRPFSEHLTKREDDQLRDKYDHNSFFYSGQRWLIRKRGAMPFSSWKVTSRWTTHSVLKETRP